MNTVETFRLPENYCNGRTYAEHCAWIDSLNEDQTIILHTPIGHRYSLVMIAVTKRFLTTKLPTETRLKLLEFLEREEASGFAVAMVQPICDDGYAIYREAQKLGAHKALDVYASWDVFNALVALNPSLLDAIKFRWPAHIWRKPQ